jgi:hypothetical protein
MKMLAFVTIILAEILRLFLKGLHGVHGELPPVALQPAQRDV